MSETKVREQYNQVFVVVSSLRVNEAYKVGGSKNAFIELSRCQDIFTCLCPVIYFLVGFNLPLHPLI